MVIKVIDVESLNVDVPDGTIVRTPNGVYYVENPKHAGAWLEVPAQVIPMMDRLGTYAERMEHRAFGTLAVVSADAFAKRCNSERALADVMTILGEREIDPA